jgi:subtilisin-like proprotein convertase family protein
LTGNVSDINFRIDGTNCSTAANSTTVGVAHTWVGDLTFTLTSPSGKTITLVERVPGGSGNSAGHNFCQTVLDDQDTTTPIDMVDTPGAPYTGRFLPNQLLAAFNGTPANGTWTLNVADGGPGDTGTVRAFSLQITTFEPCNAASPHTITSTGGAAQQAVINTTFGEQLQATVTTVGGLPIPGVAVTFTAPANGASGIFPNGNVATTDANGRARVAFKANGQPGSYSVKANTAPPLATAATFALRNTLRAPIYLPLVLNASRP